LKSLIDGDDYPVSGVRLISLSVHACILFVKGMDKLKNLMYSQVISDLILKGKRHLKSLLSDERLYYFPAHMPQNALFAEKH
jgi:hypothetical protein